MNKLSANSRKHHILAATFLAVFTLAACSTAGNTQLAADAVSAEQGLLEGSNATVPMMITAKRMLSLWYYKGCENIQILELVDLSPEEMRNKDPMMAGDKWSEKWKINACGKAAVHTVEFDLINVGGRISISQFIKPAE